MTSHDGVRPDYWLLFLSCVPPSLSFFAIQYWPHLFSCGDNLQSKPDTNQ